MNLYIYRSDVYCQDGVRREHLQGGQPDAREHACCKYAGSHQIRRYSCLWEEPAPPKRSLSEAIFTDGTVIYMYNLYVHIHAYISIFYLSYFYFHI